MKYLDLTRSWSFHVTSYFHKIYFNIILQSPGSHKHPLYKRFLHDNSHDSFSNIWFTHLPFMAPLILLPNTLVSTRPFKYYYFTMQNQEYGKHCCCYDNTLYPVLSLQCLPLTCQRIICNHWKSNKNITLLQNVLVNVYRSLYLYIIPIILFYNLFTE
jgi:hypothetical protein